MSSRIGVSANTSEVAIAVISAPRPQRTVETTLKELRRAGFSQTIHVFEEPETNVASAPGIMIHTNATRLGLWPNWQSAAYFLLQTTNEPFLLICEDDLQLCPGAAAALRQACSTLDKRYWGYVSLYSPQHNLAGRIVRTGWQDVPAGPHLWGALAYCFTRESLAAILQSRTVRLHTRNDGTDYVVSQAVQELGCRCYFHVPSLCQHAGGGISSVGHVVRSGHMAIGFSPQYTGESKLLRDAGSPGIHRNGAPTVTPTGCATPTLWPNRYLLTAPFGHANGTWRLQSVYGDYVLDFSSELVCTSSDLSRALPEWRSAAVRPTAGDWRLQPPAVLRRTPAQLTLWGVGGVQFEEPIVWEASTWSETRPTRFVPHYGDVSLVLTVNPAI